MGSDLFARLPVIWRRLDSQGILERFLSVLDNDFDRIAFLTQALLNARSVEKIDNYFLYLMSDIVGHSWRPGMPREWNRAEIRNAISKHSYKGTFARVSDTIKRYGGTYWKHTDMASQIIVPGSQGFLGGISSYLMGATLYHPGAHRFYIDEDVRDDDFEAEIELLRPAAEVWFVTYIASLADLFDLDITPNAPEVISHQITYSLGSIGPGLLGTGYLGSFWFEPFGNMCLIEDWVLVD